LETLASRPTAGQYRVPPRPIPAAHQRQLSGSGIFPRCV